MTTDEHETMSQILYCDCIHALHCNKCGKPFKDRSATKNAVTSLLTTPRPMRSNVFGHGPLLLSDIPNSAINSPVVVGIDEAGRGSVLGPMVYGMAFWSASANNHDNDSNSDMKIPKGFSDSKQLTEEVREKLWEQLLENQHIGFGVRSLLPSEISRNMLRPAPYNLNEMSHDAAMTLLRKLLNAGVSIQTCFVDTVGSPSFYQRKLEREFPGVEFVVESKADVNYAPCSAASVVAKVMRDRLLAGWKFSEPEFMEMKGNANESIDMENNNKKGKNAFGSGYPSDPKCKEWMEELHDPVFGYCDLVRFSWAPTKQKLLEKGASVVFRADLDDDEELAQQQQRGMDAFLTKKRKRSSFFEKRKLNIVSSLTN